MFVNLRVEPKLENLFLVLTKYICLVYKIKQKIFLKV